jgi:hypothetical protein
VCNCKNAGASQEAQKIYSHLLTLRRAILKWRSFELLSDAIYTL